jgi:hypothetical protein
LQQKNAMFAAGKSMMNVTKDNDQQWPSALVAINKLDGELQSKGIPASERYSGIDNKNSVLHALDPIIAYQSSAAGVSDALSKVDEDKSWMPFSAKNQIIDNFKAGSYSGKNRAQGEQVLKDGLKNGFLDEQTVKDLAVAYGYAKPSQKVSP